MRKFSLLLVALLALPLFAVKYGTIVIRDGDNHYAENHSTDSDPPNLGRHYAYFERDGVGYVIQDEATLAELRRILKPQADLGKQQAKLGTRQAALGAKQAALGAKQAELGLQQAALGAEPAGGRAGRMRELSRRQRELGQQQQQLSEQQRPLGEQQRVLGEKQRQAGQEARRHFQKLFEEAIHSGVAKRR